MYVGLNGNLFLFSYDFNKSLDVWTSFIKNPQHVMSQKSSRWQQRSSVPTDRRTNGVTWPTVAFRTVYAKAPKISERDIFLKREINGIMTFPIIY
jgi:hypothetical protein